MAVNLDMEGELSVETFPVIEIFGPTLQGEGQLVGQWSHFVRFGGCPLRCNWCDSMYAVDPKQVKANRTLMTASEILWKLEGLNLPSPWITLSGGEPAMWKLAPLVWLLQRNGFKVAVETAGVLWQDWLADCDQVTVSPKGPSSGMEAKVNWDIVERLAHLPKTSSKVVVFNKDDMDFAALVSSYFTSGKKWITPGTELSDELSEPERKELILESYRHIAEEVLARDDMIGVGVIPQMHVLLWGNVRGV